MPGLIHDRIARTRSIRGSNNQHCRELPRCVMQRIRPFATTTAPQHLAALTKSSLERISQTLDHFVDRGYMGEMGYEVTIRRHKIDEGRMVHGVATGS